MITINQFASKHIFKDPEGNFWMCQYIDSGAPDLKFCNIFAFSYDNGLDIDKPFFTTENNERTFKQCYWPDLERNISDTPITEVLFASDLLQFMNEKNFSFYSY